MHNQLYYIYCVKMLITHLTGSTKGGKRTVVGVGGREREERRRRRRREAECCCRGRRNGWIWGWVPPHWCPA